MFRPSSKITGTQNGQNLSKIVDFGVFWAIDGTKFPTLVKKCLAQLRMQVFKCFDSIPKS